jgi:ribosomal protein S18 acetylase RimI-like enzyme
MFTDLWVDHTGVPFVPDPYYAATFTFCTKDTFIDRAMTIHPSLKYDLRPAIESDVENIADLCCGFASVSEPFVLSKEGSVKEATLLVRNNQVWVHEIQRGDEPPELASIVCMTRQSADVAAVTKVYTNPKWRQLGCAERLVRRVCKYLLKTKESVVLYVAHDNKAAAKVYHRVGFVGLGEKGPSIDGVEPWLEVGFDRNVVELGHW